MLVRNIGLLLRNYAVLHPERCHLTVFICTKSWRWFLTLNLKNLKTCNSLHFLYFVRSFVTCKEASHTKNLTKGKAVPLFPCRRQEGEKKQLLLILDVDIRKGEWSASRPGRALFPGMDPGTHWIGGWVGLRAGLDTEARGKSFVPAGDRTPVVQSAVTHYTDWATLYPRRPDRPTYWTTNA
jgi:hypothetical protein